MKKVEESINNLIDDLPKLKELGGIDVFAQKTLELKLTNILYQVKDSCVIPDVMCCDCGKKRGESQSKHRCQDCYEDYMEK